MYEHIIEVVLWMFKLGLYAFQSMPDPLPKPNLLWLSVSEVSFLIPGLSGSSGDCTPVCARAKSLIVAHVSLTDSTNLCFKFAPILERFSRSS